MGFSAEKPLKEKNKKSIYVHEVLLGTITNHTWTAGRLILLRSSSTECRGPTV
uniref:Uncharacterized protein n=1 Tax=Anguilla anguilla TaxID=7936 RepID=A0A0E9U5Q8_ANGAN